MATIRVFAFDKTGTLTQNKMTVQRIHAGGETFEVSGSGYEPHGTIHQAQITIAPATKPAPVEVRPPESKVSKARDDDAAKQAALIWGEIGAGVLGVQNSLNSLLSYGGQGGSFGLPGWK